MQNLSDQEQIAVLTAITNKVNDIKLYKTESNDADGFWTNRINVLESAYQKLLNSVAVNS